jgi:hypothetical protein
VKKKSAPDKFTWKKGDIEVVKKGKPFKPPKKKEE